MADVSNEEFENFENNESEQIEPLFDEMDESITDALKDAEKISNNAKSKKVEALALKTAKARKDEIKIKKELGVPKQRQSKFPTRSHTYLSDPIADRAVHFVLNHKNSKIYLDGVDICAKTLMGIPAFAKTCNKNAFEHLIRVQEKLIENRGKNNPPNWIILSNDTALISDRNLITRLDELGSNTHAAAAYGYERIKQNGKWYEITNPLEQEYIKGCYAQCDDKSTNWDFVVGKYFKNSNKYRILIAAGPFIAVRGLAFMSMDFKKMSENMKGGFYHYMAHISMECLKRGVSVAQIKSLSQQFDDINRKEVQTDRDFIDDHNYFVSTWRLQLPSKIR